MMTSIHRTVALGALLLAVALEPAFSFVVRQNHASPQQTLSSLRWTHLDDDAEQLPAISPLNNAPQDRRQALGSSISGAAALLSMLTLTNNPTPAVAADASSIGSSPDAPIVVLGAGGKVGKLAMEILANKGLYVRATTRSGRQILDADNKFVSYAPADVTNDASLNAALKGASGCIFAASASGKKKGGEPIDVDYLGAYKTAKACLENKVPKMVLVSSGTVTRPDSAGFKATNFFVKYIYGDKIMDSKSAGEAVVRDLYASKGGPGLAYSIVRPGGLSDRPSAGSANIHVSQGDVYSSEISREDVALASIAALMKGSATDFTTFELNNVEGLYKCVKTLPDSPAELVHAGAKDYGGLMDGLLTDKAIKSKYPDLITDFRGDGIPPIEKLDK